jgi:hypothetical protein
MYKTLQYVHHLQSTTLSEHTAPSLRMQVVVTPALKKLPFRPFHAASLIYSTKREKYPGMHVANIAVLLFLWYICGNVRNIRQDIDTGSASKHTSTRRRLRPAVLRQAERALARQSWAQKRWKRTCRLGAPGGQAIFDNFCQTREPCESSLPARLQRKREATMRLPTGNHMQGTMIYLLQHERTYIAVRERMLRGG